MDIKNIKKLDKLTVQLPLLSADSTIPQTLASYTFGMVPVGYEAFKRRRVDPDRHRRLQAEELHPGPAERPRAQPELLAR